MSSQSFVYRHIIIYRFLMNVLYMGKYNERFSYVIEHIKNLPKSKLSVDIDNDFSVVYETITGKEDIVAKK